MYHFEIIKQAVLFQIIRISETEESTSRDDTQMAVEDEFKLENYDDEEGEVLYISH